MTRPIPDEVVADIFSRAYSESGSIADAFWVTSRIVGRGATHDTGAAALNEVVEWVAREDAVRPEAILGRNQSHRVSLSRFKVWWMLRRRKLSATALAAAFDRDPSVVVRGTQVFDRMLDESPDLRARMEAEAERWQRA